MFQNCLGSVAWAPEDPKAIQPSAHPIGLRYMIFYDVPAQCPEVCSEASDSSNEGCHRVTIKMNRDCETRTDLAARILRAHKPVEERSGVKGHEASLDRRISRIGRRNDPAADRAPPQWTCIVMI
jgi:hypothetical protein